MILAEVISLGWFWSIVGAFCLVVIILAVVFGCMFEDTGIWDGIADKIKCDHEWQLREDLSSHRKKVMVCKKCGKIKTVKV